MMFWKDFSKINYRNQGNSKEVISQEVVTLMIQSKKGFMSRRHKKHSSIFSSALVVFIMLSLVALLIAYKLYLGVFAPNINPAFCEKHPALIINSESSYQDVLSQLETDSVLLDMRSFKLLAKKMNYPNKVFAGHYRLNDQMSNYELIRLLRSGDSPPFMVAIDKYHTIYELAGGVGASLEIDSADIVKYMLDRGFLNAHKLTKDNALTFFIPNSYEFYWNTSLKKFFARMENEADKFWTEERINKAEAIRFSKAEVYTLASIVQEEAAREDEMERIAGVYLNRIRKRIRLEADPTIKFLVRNRKDNKVYLSDYEIVSPYNTYRNSGLPPGPIIQARMGAMDAVLNAERHNYLYFCAKADGSGYHLFTNDYKQHVNNRRLYLKSKKK
ncbi:endolytic transglycosylase MltG [Bacteroidota bacterium]